MIFLDVFSGYYVFFLLHEVKPVFPERNIKHKLPPLLHIPVFSNVRMEVIEII